MFTVAVGRKSEFIYKKETNNKPSRNFYPVAITTFKVFFITGRLVTRLYCAWLGRQTFFLNLCKVASTVLLFTVNGPSICVVHVVMKSSM